MKNLQEYPGPNSLVGTLRARILLKVLHVVGGVATLEKSVRSCALMAHSPRTTRRNMLATELTESLRRHLLWERQQKSATASIRVCFSTSLVWTNSLVGTLRARILLKVLHVVGPKGPHKGVGPNQASAEADPNAADLGKNGSWTNYTNA
jgi:hypothetical protein